MTNHEVKLLHDRHPVFFSGDPGTPYATVCPAGALFVDAEVDDGLPVTCFECLDQRKAGA